MDRTVYIVICLDDTDFDGVPGRYIQAAGRVFRSHADALGYAEGVAPGRLPLVIERPRFESDVDHPFKSRAV